MVMRRKDTYEACMMELQSVLWVKWKYVGDDLYFGVFEIGWFGEAAYCSIYLEGKQAWEAFRRQHCTGNVSRPVPDASASSRYIWDNDLCSASYAI